MKILVLASNPRKDLNLETEIKRLQSVIERSKNRKYLEVEVGFAVQPDDLQELLLKHEPDIVHFCGHGTGKQGLVLQDNNQREKLVSTDALSNLFELCSGWVKCVLLNACYSEIQANAIVEHIDYAIGMNHEIKDSSAIAFATGFYQALGYGQSIEQSYKFGCNAIQLEISDNSVVRSVLSAEQRKLEVAKTLETVIIPEHLKPVLRKKKDLTVLINHLASSSKLDLQSQIDQALELDNLSKQEPPKFKKCLADRNIRSKSDSFLSQKTRKLIVSSAVASLALAVSFPALQYISSSQEENDRQTQVAQKRASVPNKPIEKETVLPKNSIPALTPKTTASNQTEIKAKSPVTKLSTSVDKSNTADDSAGNYNRRSAKADSPISSNPSKAKSPVAQPSPSPVKTTLQSQLQSHVDKALEQKNALKQHYREFSKSQVIDYGKQAELPTVEVKSNVLGDMFGIK